MINPPPAPAAMPPGEPPLRPGAGTLMGRNRLGTWVDAPRGGREIRHPFLVTVGGKSATIGKGYILAESAVEPLIGSVPISGDKDRRVPFLKLDPELVNGRGESWVCVQVTPNDEGKVTEKDELVDGAEVEILQSPYPFATVGKSGRAPLAQLVRQPRNWQVWQITLFHYRYVTSQPADGPRRHFFV